jgi:hypothetical protein
MMDFDTWQEVLKDIALGTPPDASRVKYTPEMLRDRRKAEVEIKAHKAKNPGAFIHIPSGIEGLPGGEDEGAPAPDEKTAPPRGAAPGPGTEEE